MAYIEKNDYQGACYWFSKGIEVNPNYYALYYGLALTYNKLGHIDTAIRLSEQSMSLNPDHH